MTDDPTDLLLPLPQLCDEAAVHILEFLAQFTQAFEAAYSDQIRRYYQDLESSGHQPHTPPPTDRLDDPPF